MNRTGVQMSPFDTNAMQSGMGRAGAQLATGNESSIAEMRRSCHEEAEPLGSVPVPSTIKGTVAAGLSMLTGNQPQLLLDKLGERLAFERTGTRLYEALIAKFEATEQGTTSIGIEDLQKIRDDEARHFAIIASAIESVGGDPTSQTPCADLVGVESLGLMQVVTDPRTTLAQSLHAILVAEMTDLSGWVMLIMLAEDPGQLSMIPKFQLTLDEERGHLQQIQTWFEEATFGIAVSDEAQDTDQLPSTPLH